MMLEDEQVNLDLIVKDLFPLVTVAVELMWLHV